MPNCFQLRKIGATEPSKFAEIDNEMCAYFGVEPDPVKYYEWWYDFVGLRLAIGKTFDEIQAEAESYGDWERMVRIVKWMKERYTSSAWYQPKSFGE